KPTINWNGKLLGCCKNHWGDFGANIFRDGLVSSVNNEKMSYARAMLLGQAPPRYGIPCTTCPLYKTMYDSANWLTPDEIEDRLGNQPITLSIILPEVGEDRRLQIFVLRGNVPDVSEPRLKKRTGVEYVRGEQQSVVTRVSSAGEHTVCVIPISGNRCDF